MKHQPGWLLILLVGCQRGSDDGPPATVGSAPLRRLTRAEYDNTVFDLLGDASQPARAFTPDEEVNGYDNQAAAQTVSVLLAEQYQVAAEALAVNNLGAVLSQAPSCAGGPPADCDAEAAAFVASFGRRAFRRPLSAEELTDYQALFSAAATLGGAFDGATGLQLVVEAMLQSPQFLYRPEFGAPGEPGATTPLTSYEIASRLSYTLWASMPDDELLDAADAGLLLSADEIAYQAERMLAAPRARDAVKRFFGLWLGLDDVVTYVGAAGKDLALYPDYRASDLPFLVQEAEFFIEYVVFEERAGAGELFTAPYTMMNAEVAEFYGVDASNLGETYQRVDLDGRYAGILSQPGLLALHASRNNTSPVHRGLFIRESFFCQPPPPMPDVIPEAPDVDLSLPTREQYIQHAEDPACSGCHLLMDPIGFGFESFDAIGRYRAEQAGVPIDDSGEIFGTADADGPFDGVAELGATLAGSAEVRDCVTSQWFTFAFGRSEEEADAATLAAMRDRFVETDLDLQALIIATTLSDSFRYRIVADPLETAR